MDVSFRDIGVCGGCPELVPSAGHPGRVVCRMSFAMLERAPSRLARPMTSAEAVVYEHFDLFAMRPVPRQCVRMGDYETLWKLKEL